jgi:DNA repair exonuclease SbcCD nuclease subunit
LRERGVDLIVLAGDIAHTKTKISPEFVQLCSNFFESLADIAPLVIAPGNHDGNLNNLTRLDALTPIVEALDHKRIYYFKESGVYRVPEGFTDFDLHVVHFSCFDKNWPTKEDVEAKLGFKDDVTIGLYHGFVKGVTLQNGMVVDDAPSVHDFLNVADYVMMGDVHKMQIMDLQSRSAYCGSYPQQNYGESVDKGYLLWEIEGKNKHNVDFVKLPNVCPFYTIRLEDDLKIPDLDLQPRSRIRVLSRQLTVLEKNMLRDRLTEAYEPNRLDWLDDLNPHRQRIEIDKADTKIESLDDLGVQEKLLVQFLEQYDLSEDTVQRIFEINRRYNAHIRNEEDILRNVLYRIGKLK